MTSGARLPPTLPLHEAYRLRWARRRALWRSFRSRHRMTKITDRTRQIRKNDLLCVMCVRNEAARLPWFLKHTRGLGVDHFLIVDNDSTDGTAAFLTEQPDVSIWHTADSYRRARFGLDWMTWLQMRYAHGHWCLMLDADELLVYDGCDRHDLHALTALLDAQDLGGFGTLMLDLYPKGPLDRCHVAPDRNPAEVLCWFDPGPYRASRQHPRSNLWVQGGLRERVFFAKAPSRGPTLNKVPLIKWHRRYAYTNSCHAALPRPLNHLYDGPGETRPAGVLLHTKFLPEAPARAAEEKKRREHFGHPDLFDSYYDRVATAPDLWRPGSRRLDGPESLIDAGLMPRIAWSGP